MSDVSLEGYNELVKQFDQIANEPDTDRFERKLILRARKLRTDIRRKTPRSTKWSGSVGGKSGNLRKAIEARRFKRKIKGSPSVYVRVNRKKAPHYHLVEFGTEGFRFPSGKEVHTIRFSSGNKIYIKRDGPKGKQRKALHFILDGQEIFVKWVGPMPQRPFFRPTVDSKKTEIINGIKSDISQSIEEISNKNI